MVKMQPLVKQWYDFLAEDKVMGLRCNRCGSYEFPPVPVCNNCSGTDLVWIEMSGEGPTFHTMILGVDPEDTAALYHKLPLSVKAETQDRGDHKFVVFRAKK